MIEFPTITNLLVSTAFIWVALATALKAGAIPYVLFPGFVRLIQRFKRPAATPKAFDVSDETLWPQVDLVFAAYNEETVLREKLSSLQNLDYPKGKLNVWVGSDLSTDATEEILAEMAESMPELCWERMPQRSGKSKIINHLVAQGDAEVIVGTDANIFFHPMALKHLLAPLVLDSRTSLVGGELTYRGMGQGDSLKSIASQERSYIGWENRTKVCEGELWGMTMGVEGGCYAIRRSSFVPIPPGTFMEDFFLTIRVLASGQKVQHAALATCTEDVSNDAHMEYRRKVRISHGNWQNIFRFHIQLTARSVGLLFVFTCHKLLRWIFPVLVLGFLIYQVSVSILILIAAGEHLILALNLGTFGVGLLLLLYPRTFLPKRLAKLLKPLSYFLWMNIALIHGLIQFIRTPSNASGVWQPTKRNNQ
ncbi:MAG: glycosyltransferase [Schleiferiaceae bacterium]|nr:glycosyltransferase [Schleiferiaceae bacterium]